MAVNKIGLNISNFKTESKKDLAVFNIAKDGSVKIKNYKFFFEAVINHGPILKNQMAFYHAYQKYHSFRLGLIRELELDQMSDDKEIIEALRKEFVYLKESDHRSYEVQQFRRDHANMVIDRLNEHKRNYFLYGLPHGDLYSLASELLAKNDLKNAKMALAIAYVFTLYHPGTNTVSVNEYHKHMKLLPKFVKRYYQDRDFSEPLRGSEYKAIKQKLLEMLHEY